MRRRTDPVGTAAASTSAQQTLPATEARASVETPQEPKASPLKAVPRPTAATPRLPEPYGRIVTTVFDMPDPYAEFEHLRADLEFSKVEPSRADYGTVIDALDDAEKNAHRAVELVVNFEAVSAAFEMDTLAISGPLRERARSQLEKENRKLKQLVADLSLDKHILQDVLAKKP
jgi:hypothetical protein